MKILAQAIESTGTARHGGAGRKQEKQRTQEIAEMLPRGIAIGWWADGRGKPFFVRYGYGRTRKMQSFSAESDRNDRAEALAALKEEHGNAVLEFDPKTLIEWRAFRMRCPAPLAEIERVWEMHGKPKVSMPLNVAIESYLKMRLEEDHVNPKKPKDGFRHARLHLTRLSSKLGTIPINQVTPELIRQMMDSLIDPISGRAMTNTTKRDHRKNWRTFFTRCVREGWVERNPCELVVPPPVEEDDPDVLAPREVFDLLRANRDQPVIGRMAFELYGGLRSSSAARLVPDHVKRDVRGIRLPGALHKSGKMKFRQGHPDVLWEWFDHAGAEMWIEVTQKNYDERKRDAFVRAGVRNPGNILRTTCASYLLALTKDMPRVGYLLQHTRIQTTMIYEGVADERDAALVMAMTPKAMLLSWEEFVQTQPKINEHTDQRSSPDRDPSRAATTPAAAGRP